MPVAEAEGGTALSSTQDMAVREGVSRGEHVQRCGHGEERIALANAVLAATRGAPCAGESVFTNARSSLARLSLCLSVSRLLAVADRSGLAVRAAIRTIRNIHE